MTYCKKIILGIGAVTVVAVAGLLLLKGFDASKPSSAVSPELEKGGDEVLLTVNGHQLTVAQRAAKVNLMLNLARMGSNAPSGDALKGLARQLADSYAALFTRQALFMDYAAREGVVVSDEDMTRFRDNARRSMAARGIRAKTYDDLLARLGDNARGFDDQVRDEALSDAVCKHIVASNPTNFSSDFVEMKQEEIRLHNEAMAISNVVIYARATNVWEQLKETGGSNFVELVQKYSEITAEIPDKGEWGTLEARQLVDDPEVYRYATTLPIGGFSPPIEGDNGLMIMRLDSKNEESKEFTLSRIHFLLPNFWPNLTPEQILENARREHEKRVYIETVKALYDAAEIKTHHLGKAAEEEKEKK